MDQVAEDANLKYLIRGPEGMETIKAGEHNSPAFI
jgi:hypothetical protein